MKVDERNRPEDHKVEERDQEMKNSYAEKKENPESSSSA